MDYEEVAGACDRLFARGYSARQISFTNVRDVLGRGDKGNILTHIKKWKSDHAEELEQREVPSEMPVPSELATMISKCLASAAADAVAKIRAEYVQLNIDAEKREEQLAQAVADVERLTAELNKEQADHAETRGKLAQLESNFASMQNVLNQETETRKSLEAKIAQAQDSIARVQSLEASLREEKEKQVALQARLEETQEWQAKFSAETQEWKAKFDDQSKSLETSLKEGATVSAQYENLKEYNDKLLQNVAELNSTINAQVAELRKADKDKADAISAAKDELRKELEKKLKEVQDARLAAEQRATAAETEKKYLNLQIAELTKKQEASLAAEQKEDPDDSFRESLRM